MSRSGLLPLAVLGLLVPLASACVENTAPGNDREAELSPPEPPASVASVGEAIAGVQTGLLVPETMTEADRGNVPEGAGGCLFRFTRVGLPVLAYGSAAVLKLNGKLVPLPAAGEGRYAADGVTVMIRPLDEDAGEDGPFAAELVVRLPDADHELGYHGFSECGRVAGAA